VAVSPPDLESRARALRAIERATTFTRISALALMVLAGLSTAVNAPHPLSAHFVISVLALGNGVIEWRLARRLRARDASVLGPLAANQLVLGAEIFLYGVWQAVAVDPAQIAALLRQPPLREMLDALPVAQQRLLLDMLPSAVRAMYLIVGAGALLGCAAIALYHRSRRRHFNVAGAPSA
jgi:hypothetical protein